MENVKFDDWQNLDLRAGKISNINTEVKLEDARVIREQLAKGAERFFQFGLCVNFDRDSEVLST